MMSIIFMVRQGRDMQITVNQHYVPRFYMKHFANIKNAGIKKSFNFILPVQR